MIAQASLLDPTTTTALPDVLPGLGELALRTALATGAVIVVAFVALLLLRRRGFTGKGRSQRMKLVESLPLPRGQAVYLLEVDGRPMLLAMSNGTSSMHPLPVGTAAAASDPRSPEDDPHGFDHLLRDRLGAADRAADRGTSDVPAESKPVL